MVADAGQAEPTLPGGPRRPAAHLFEAPTVSGMWASAIYSRRPAAGRRPVPASSPALIVADQDLGFRRSPPSSSPRQPRRRATPAGYLAGFPRRAADELDEVAVGVRGPLPRRQGPEDPLADWLGGNTNGVVSTPRIMLQKDLERVIELTGKVDPAELLSYVTPLLLHQQSERIDPINEGITSIINDMARDRRELLQMKLRKKIIEARHREISGALICRPGKVQEMQG